MKPKNFPGRKAARRVAAAIRLSGWYSTTARSVRMFGCADEPYHTQLANASTERTKKARASRGY